MLTLMIKNEKLFAVDDRGNFAGQIINSTDGSCVDYPELVLADDFARIYSGHGDIYHLATNPINPFWSRPEAVFANPEQLPIGTAHVFVDTGADAFDNFNARLINSCN